jgi:hypothetical protein
MTHPGLQPSPLRDWVGYFHHDRFRGYVPVHCRSGLQPPCLRFAMTVTGHHARLGTPLRARLYGGRHLRRLNPMRLQGATRTDPYVRNSRIRFLSRAGDAGPQLTAPRMRAAPGTQLSRHRVRPVLCSSAFLAIPPLPSIDSATSKLVLFADFIGTTSECDFSSSYIIGFGSSPSRCGPSMHTATGGQAGDSPGSRTRSVRACQGLRPRGVGQALALARLPILPSASVTASAPRKSDFRGSMAGLHLPLSTLRVMPRDIPRMTRGQCGSLRLHRQLG